MGLRIFRETKFVSLPEYSLKCKQRVARKKCDTTMRHRLKTTRAKVL